MKAYNTQQEVILVTDTGFTAREYNVKNTTDSNKNLSEREKLQEACWNGLIQEKLPEIFIPVKGAEKMYMWQLRESNHLLTMEMGEYPKDIEVYFSIDPYVFMALKSSN